MTALAWSAGRWLIGSQVGPIILIVLASLTAFSGWTWKVARDAQKATMERVLKSTELESSRRLRELNAVAIEAAAREALLAESQAKLAALKGERDALSKANNDRVCLDTGGVLRLDSIRQDRRPRSR